jgi:hypothetical protein
MVYHGVVVASCREPTEVEPWLRDFEGQSNDFEWLEFVEELKELFGRTRSRVYGAVWRSGKCVTCVASRGVERTVFAFPIIAYEAALICRDSA